jgi:UDP-N-acetylmuramate: L-alanyl-gamma-D-glutamyl-meso-diaminopimelate ligase
LRTVPGSGRILCNGSDANLQRVLSAGCWTPVEKFARAGGEGVQWSVRAPAGADYSRFQVLGREQIVGEVQWNILGAHNVDNALAALGAARHAGVPIERGIDALSRFNGVARRMQLRGEAAGIQVYDDFAHHPTAIATTIDGLRRRVGAARIIAVLEPRSQTMRLGVHQASLAASLAGADEVWLYAPPDLGWNARAAVAALGARAFVLEDLNALAATLVKHLRSGDQVLIMSNGGFGGLHSRLLDALASRAR